MEKYKFYMGFNKNKKLVNLYIEDNNDGHRMAENELKKVCQSKDMSIWGCFNSMEMKKNEEKSELIEVLAREIEGKDILDVLLHFALNTVKNMSTNTYRLCEQALLYSAQMGVYHLGCGIEKSIIIFIAFKIWNVIEEESSSWYKPSKESIRIRNSNIDTSQMSPLEAAMTEYAGYYNEVAEEIYIKAPNTSDMLIRYIR